MRARLSWSIPALAILWLAVVAACTPHDDPTSRARDLERRILAPCCFRQTLEDHDSDIAHKLRAEIERRTAVGESSDVIEDDLVRRYGEDVRAMPRGLDPRALLGIAVAVVLGLGALVIRRFVRARPTVEARATSPAGDDRDLEYQERLDDELDLVD